MTTTHTTEYLVRIRCGGVTYFETIYTYDTETAWGHQIRIENQYERDYGHKARITSIRPVK